MAIADFSKDNNPYVRVMSGGYTLSNLKTLISVADREKFGVVACNIRSRFVLNGVLEAAWQQKSPVILEIAESEVSYCNISPARLAELPTQQLKK